MGLRETGCLASLERLPMVAALVSVEMSLLQFTVCMKGCALVE